MRGSVDGGRHSDRDVLHRGDRSHGKLRHGLGGSLHISDKPQKGETVLIHAAAGGIGSAAVQPAKAAGATELATASAGNIGNAFAGRRSRVRLSAVGLRGGGRRCDGILWVDLIIDFVGGSYLVRNIRSLAPGGRLVQVGLLGRDDNAIIPLDCPFTITCNCWARS